jgi:hypothetical protein
MKQEIKIFLGIIGCAIVALLIVSYTPRRYEGVLWTFFFVILPLGAFAVSLNQKLISKKDERKDGKNSLTMILAKSILGLCLLVALLIAILASGI